MQLITAIIQPTKLAAVQAALARIGVEHLTVCDAQSFLLPADPSSGECGKRDTPPLLRKLELQIVVNDDFVDRTVNTILRVARSGAQGQHGDGTIFVSPVGEAVRIIDLARGPEAVS